MSHETHLPAEQEKAPKDLRISQTDENGQGARGDQPPPQSRPQASERLKKTSRIRHRDHYQALLKAGLKISATQTLIHCRRTAATCPKVGITASRRFGKAHERNRFKRLVREAFRREAPLLPAGLEVHLSPRVPPSQITLQGIVQDLRCLPR